MTAVGQAYRGIWPEHSVSKPRVGDTVRYPEAQTGIIRQGTIRAIAKSTVYFTNGDWAYIHELSADKD